MAILWIYTIHQKVFYLKICIINFHFQLWIQIYFVHHIYWASCDYNNSMIYIHTHNILGYISTIVNVYMRWTKHELGNIQLPGLISISNMMCYRTIWARFLTLAQSKLRLCSANLRAGYLSNLTRDWLSMVWAYSKQKTENGPWLSLTSIQLEVNSEHAELF